MPKKAFLAGLFVVVVVVLTRSKYLFFSLVQAQLDTVEKPGVVAISEGRIQRRVRSTHAAKVSRLYFAFQIRVVHRKTIIEKGLAYRLLMETH